MKPNRYLRKRSTRAALAMLAALPLAALPQISAAEDNAPLKRGGFQLEVSPVLEFSTVIVNIGPDGSGAILSAPIVLNMKGKIDFRRRNGYIERGGLFAGHCRRTDCGPIHKLLWYRSRYKSDSTDGGGFPENDWRFDHPISTTPERLLLPTHQIDLIHRCGEPGADEFYTQSTVTLSVNTLTEEPRLGTDFIGPHPFVPLDEIEFNGGDQSRHASFDLKVLCQPVSHSVSNTDPEQPSRPKTPKTTKLGFDQGPMKVNDIKMSLTTYSNAYSEPNHGTRCKRAKLRVTLDTNQEGLISFKLWSQRGDGAIENEDVILGAHHDDGLFKAVHERWIDVDETTFVQFKARDLVNETFYNETGWESITLHCTGAGGGGLASPTVDRDDEQPVISSFAGNFHVIDKVAARGRYSCPRAAKALVWFDAPKADSIHYSLDCGGLGNFSGVIQPEKIASSQYRAADLIDFELTETIDAGCTLRTVSPGAPRDHVMREQKFICAATAGHGAGSGLADPSNPDRPGIPDPAGNPSGAVPIPVAPPQARVPVPVSPLVCKGGKVRYGACFCDDDTTRVRTGANTYHCRPQAKRTNPDKATPTRTNPPAPTRTNPPTPTRTNPPAPKLVCLGGKLKGGACRCGGNTSRVKIGANAYQCKQQAKRTNPAKTAPTRTNPAKATPTRTNPKKTRLVCKGGTARGGKCKCGSNTTRVKLAANAWQCKPKAKRTNPKKTGATRTNPAPKKLVCVGGKVRGNKCQCGSKMVRRKVKPNTYQCVRRTG